MATARAAAVAAYRAATALGDRASFVADGGGDGVVASLKKYVPLFVVGFVGMAGLRTVGDATLAVPTSPGGTYLDPGATASDILDGDLSAAVVVSGDIVNLAQVGTYTVLYDVKDAAGHAAATVPAADGLCGVFDDWHVVC